MRLAPLMIVFAAVLASAQTPASKPSDPALASAVDPKLHADAVTLVEVSGVEKKVQDSLPKSLNEGVKAMKDKCPTCTQEFYDEWVKRMTLRLKASAFAAVWVEAYEKYLTDSEILEMTAMQRQINAGTTPTPSDALKAKLTSVMPTFLGEIYGKSSQIAATLGAAVGGEIGKEHPEYLIGKPATPKPELNP